MYTRNRANWHCRVRNFFASLLVPAVALLTTPATAHETGGSPAGTAGLEMDLSSQTQSIHVGSEAFKRADSATINVGGAEKTITPGSHVTPAELVAVQQVLGRGNQRLVLDAAGAAVGGAFRLSSLAQTQLSSLVIPAGVVGIGRAGRGVDVTGNLTAAGVLLGVGRASDFSINAGNVSVAPGGSITTVITPALAEIVNRRSQRLDLGIFSGGDVLNSGTISSSRNLVIEALGKISNVPVPG